MLKGGDQAKQISVNRDFDIWQKQTLKGVL